MGETRIEGMDLCLACNGVQPFLGYVQGQQVEAQGRKE